MKRLSEYINDQYVIEEIRLVDDEIITEALKSSILQKLAKQLLDQRTAEKEKIDSIYKDRTYKPSLVNDNFRKIFNRTQVDWSNVTDDDFDIVEVPKKETDNDRIVRKMLRGGNYSIIFAYNETLNKFTYVAFPSKSVIKLYDGAGRRIDSDTKEAYKIEMFRGCKLYILKNLGDVEFSRNVVRNERLNARTGMINPKDMDQIAQQNKERYKKIISKRQIERIDDDKLIDRANAMIKEIADITTKVAKSPDKYADCLYEISSFIKKAYTTSSYSYSGYGLLPTLVEYTNSLKAARLPGAFGYSSYRKKEVDEYREKLDKLVTNLENDLETIKEKMDS